MLKLALGCDTLVYEAVSFVGVMLLYNPLRECVYKCIMVVDLRQFKVIKIRAVHKGLYLGLYVTLNRSKESRYFVYDTYIVPDDSTVKIDLVNETCKPLLTYDKRLKRGRSLHPQSNKIGKYNAVPK